MALSGNYDQLVDYFCKKNVSSAFEHESEIL